MSNIIKRQPVISTLLRDLEERVNDIPFCLISGNDSYDLAPRCFHSIEHFSIWDTAIMEVDW